MQPKNLVLILARDEADADRLHAELIKVHAIRVVGAVWESADVNAAATAFGATLLVQRAGTTRPATPLPHLEVAADAAASEVVNQYLARANSAAAQEKVLQAAETPPPDAAPATKLALPSPRRTPRLGFWGRRGGVGTTSAAVEAAQQLVAQGFEVALYDAPERGDTFLWLGHTPQSQPYTIERLTLYPQLPATLRADGAALVIDGGRQRRECNVKWIEVHKPVSQELLARILAVLC